MLSAFDLNYLLNEDLVIIPNIFHSAYNLPLMLGKLTYILYFFEESIFVHYGIFINRIPHIKTIRWNSWFLTLNQLRGKK